MWVLLGIREDTAERESYVHFIGIYNDFSILQGHIEHLITTTKSKRSDYIVKPVYTNTLYSYDWCYDESDVIKTITL